MKQQLRSLLGIAGVALVGVISTSASTLTYNFGAVSDGTSPAGAPPWLQAVISDAGLPPNTVNLTLNAGNLTGNDFVSSWYFNLKTPHFRFKTLHFNLEMGLFRPETPRFNLETLHFKGETRRFKARTRHSSLKRPVSTLKRPIPTLKCSWRP